MIPAVAQAESASLRVGLRRRWRTVSWLGAIAVLALAGAFVGSYPAYLLEIAMINVVAAIGLNLLTGNSGQISLCHSSFMALGAYGTALAVARIGAPFVVAVPAAAAAAALAGAGLGFPAKRLQGIYLALATLGFLEIVQIGILSVAKPMAFGNTRLPGYAMYLVVLAVCAFAVWTARNVAASRVGREFDAVRLSPHAAQALGISVGRVKLVAFALSAAYAALAGGLLAVVVGFIDPIEFGVTATLRQITFIVVGGLGSVAGSVIGAVALSILGELLRPVKEYADLVYTGILLGSLLFMPRGLVTLWNRVAARVASPGGRVSSPTGRGT
jgi:ABC-type branched-subunit amino acid transport system permease subunit